MATDRLARLLLRLYPRAFRGRFGTEWLETAAWYTRDARPGRLGSLRLAARLLADTLRTLPHAYLSGGPPGRRPAGASPGRWGQDLGFAARAVVRSPVFTVAAVGSIALGIASNTAVFSVVNGVLLRPLPYVDPDRLMVVWNEFPGAGLSRLPMSGPELQVLRGESEAFEGVAGIWATSGTVVEVDGTVSQLSTGLITPDLFDLLGVQAHAGRLFERAEGEEPTPAGVVLSHALWQQRYGGDRAVIGTTIQLNGRPTQVVGVLPEGFTLFFSEDSAVPPTLDAYTALPWDLAPLPPEQHFLRVVARVRPGVGVEDAGAAAARASGVARRLYPGLEATGDHFTVRPLHEDSVSAARPALLVLLGSVGLFLLLSLANVSNLVLARTLARGREFAIRSAIGASAGSLARLVVAEVLILSVVGSLVGLALGHLGTTALWGLRPLGLARASDVPLDHRVLGFTLGMSVAAALGIALGSLAAVRSVRSRPGAGGRGDLPGGPGRRLRELGTVLQLAVGVVLVTGSSLMIQSLRSLGQESVGFEPAGALTFRVALNMGRFPTDGERARLAREVERKLADIPGVTEAGATSHLPFVEWANWAEAAPPEGTPASERSAYYADLRAVTPSYLRAIGARVVAGRHFEETDDASGAPVVIIDETMARRIFPEGDPVGRTVLPSRFVNGSFSETPARVVGVVQDIRDRSPAHPSTGQVFWPFAQSPRWELTYFVRTGGDPSALAAAVPGAVRAVDPDLVAARIAPMDAHVRSATGITRFLALVGTIFSGLAVLLAAIGLYGLVAFVATQRTREVGVRMALGARAPEVLGGVLRHGARVAGAGVLLGLAGALGAARLLAGLVYGVSPHDPVTLGGVCVALVVVALAASLGPAHRATRTDPALVLREP
ncbi:MAG: hypothetical protein AMXMBFR53_35340 [Gemmatimonadota bacterium]